VASLNVYRTADDVLRVSRVLKAIQRAHGIDKPLWLTETNAMPTDDRSIAPCDHGGDLIKTTMEQQAAFGALGQVLAQAYAQADDGEHTHAAAVDAGAYHVLWQSRTSAFESATDPAQPVPTFLMPEGGVTLEIVPVDEASVVVPMPEPTPTPTPAPTPRRTPRPGRRRFGGTRRTSRL